MATRRGQIAILILTVLVIAMVTRIAWEATMSASLQPRQPSAQVKGAETEREQAKKKVKVPHSSPAHPPTIKVAPRTRGEM